jgi:hypothetical protein
MAKRILGNGKDRGTDVEAHFKLTVKEVESLV